MSELAETDSARPRRLLIWYGLAAVIAVFAYFYGLDSDHIPRNGDELPYAQITRLTAATGHLLPLQSEKEKEGLRNTKPPLLFWQGIASTDWGKNWTLECLRYPSVIYTLLTASLVFLLGWKLSQRLETGFVALLTFLAFFSTYRYGRPFLTDSPLVFWLFVPLFTMLYWRPAMFESRLLAPPLLGLAVGVGLLYKSFAFLLPVALCFSWWYLRERNYSVKTFLARDAWKIAVIGIVSLALFSLWFLLDPNPQAVFRDFVLRENAGKFGSHGGYLKNLLWGDSSIWRLVVSYPLNAGLLGFPVVALFFVVFKRRTESSDGEKLLWIWVGTLFVVFALPSQRDERYLLPAMPALAVLCALNWQQIGRPVFNASLVVIGVLVLVMVYLSWRLEQAVPGARVYPPAYWLLPVGTGVLVIVALARPGFTRAAVNVAAILALFCFAAFMRPFDGPLGTYSAEVQQFAKGREVWVPVNFMAVEEGYRFFLPGADIHGYKYDPKLTIADLSNRYPLFAMRLPMGTTSATNTYGNKVIGQRMYLGSRHTSKQIMQIIQGKLFEYLFLKELLIEAPGSTTNGAAQPAGAAQP
jgi:4-amino-4-deoxy-L-arabinose transferase-like glycosyltransferase